MGQTLSRRLGDLVLGPAGPQRLRALQSVLVVLVDVLLSFVCAFGAWAGLIDGRLALAWSGLTLGGVLVFYAVVRSGWNLRFTDDPALTLPQGVFSVFSTVGAYLICGPVRGASLLALAITLVFGLFALKPGQVRRLCLFAVLLLGVAMAWGHHRWPQRFPAAEEAMHFMLVAVVLPAIAVLSGQLSTMRHKLRQHRMELERALEQIRQLAIRDELTGLHNRRHVAELLHKEAHRRVRSGRPLTLALLDLDHFKRINDTYGHAQGDVVLRSFAACASAALRDTDTLGRWGGEEFIVMLPETDADTALAVLDRVRRRLEDVSFEAIAPALRVTFSAGVAAARPGECMEEVVARADAAMYAAKQAGRNCSVADGVVPATPARPSVARAQAAVPSSTP